MRSLRDGEENLEQSISSFNIECRPTIIRPWETTYAYADVKHTGDTTAEFICLPHLTVKDASSADDIRYEVSDEVSFASDTYFAGFKASGTIVSNTEKVAASIRVDVLVFNKNGDYYTTLTSYVSDDLEPGASVSFTASNWNYIATGMNLSPMISAATRLLPTNMKSFTES